MLKIPVIFHITTYPAGLEKIAMSVISNIMQPVEMSLWAMSDPCSNKMVRLTHQGCGPTENKYTSDPCPHWWSLWMTIQILGVYLNKLYRTKHSEVVKKKKGQCCLYIQRKLRPFHLCTTMLRMFYECVVTKTVLFAAVCWGSRLKVADCNRPTQRAGDVVQLDSMTAATERRWSSKLGDPVLVNFSYLFHNSWLKHVQ